PAMNADRTNDIQRDLTTLLPIASAAWRLSRDARRFIPSDDSLKRNATSKITTAQTKADHISVYRKMQERVSGPLVTWFHCDSTTFTINSSAKDEMAAAVSDNLMSAIPVTAAKIPASVAPIRIAGKKPTSIFFSGS